MGFFAVDVLSHAVWPLLYHSSKHVGLVESDDFLPVLAAARSAMGVGLRVEGICFLNHKLTLFSFVRACISQSITISLFSVMSKTAKGKTAATKARSPTQQINLDIVEERNEYQPSIVVPNNQRGGSVTSKKMNGNVC